MKRRVRDLLIQRNSDIDDLIVERAELARFARQEVDDVELKRAVHRQRRHRSVGNTETILEPAVDVESRRRAGIDTECARGDEQAVAWRRLNDDLIQ